VIKVKIVKEIIKHVDIQKEKIDKNKKIIKMSKKILY